MLPHVAESRVGVLINNSTVGTESELPAPPIKVKQLPHNALVMVEVQQKELLVSAYSEFGRHNSCQAWCAFAGEGGQGCRKILLQPLQSV